MWTIKKDCEVCAASYIALPWNAERQRFCSARCKDIDSRHTPKRREWLKKYRSTSKRLMYESKWRRDRRRNHPEVKALEQDYQRRKYKNRRIELMNILNGPNCLNCDCIDYSLLQFHHIDPSTAIEDRIRFRDKAQMVRHYIGFPDEARGRLQVLCRTCNMDKRRECA